MLVEGEIITPYILPRAQKEKWTRPQSVLKYLDTRAIVPGSKKENEKTCTSSKIVEYHGQARWASR
jgi:hypothetical protein